MASSPPSHDSLEFPHDRADRPWELRAQRAGWLAFAALILAAIAGLLGPGPLSRDQVTDPAGQLTIEYNRFERYQRQTELRIRVAPAAVRDGQVRIWVGQAFSDDVEIVSIQPQAERTELGSDRHVLLFPTPRLNGEATVTIRYAPDRTFGWIEGQIGIEGGPALAISQFIYP